MDRESPLLRAYPLYQWGVYIPFLGLSTALLGTAASLVAPLAGPPQASRIGMLWSRANAAMTPMRVNLVGRERIDPAQSYVIVANHQSHFDVFALYGWLPIDFRWVMKAELRRVPFLGFACEQVGHVFIDRSNPRAAAAAIDAARPQLVGGTSIIFFPEGTRSDDGALLPFKKGAFHLALELGLPVLPVAITGTKHILPNRTLRLRPGRVEMVVCDPIPVDGYARDEVDALSAASRAAIQGVLDHAESKRA